MKIALCFASGFNTKMGYMELAIAKEFRRLGHQIVIITKDRHPDYVDYKNSIEKILGPRILKPGIYQEDGFEVHRLKTRTFGRNKKFEIVFGIFRELMKIKPDMIFYQTVEDIYGAVQAVLANIFLRKKIFFVLNEHFIFESSINEIPKSIKHKINTYFEKRIKKQIVKYADKIVAMNEYCYDVALKILNNNPEKIIAVTLGVDHNRTFFKPEARKSIRKNFNVLDDEVLIIHTGKMHTKKKTELILEAMHRINNDSLKLLLVGSIETNYRSNLKSIIKNLNLESKVFFVPFVKSEELHHYFSASDIAVWPDSATISTLEASAVGIPIIVPDFHGYEHRVKYSNGLKIKRGDINGLIEKIEYLISDKDIRIEMGKRGVELIKNELNWEKISEKILIEY